MSAWLARTLWAASKTGVDPKEVSVRAGHSSVAFTLDRYGHLFEDDEDAISDRLDAVLQQAKKTRREKAE